MKKQVISLLLCTVMLLCVLTGCIHQDMGVKMNKDGTGSITTTVGIKKDFYEQMKTAGSDPFEGKTVSEYQYDGDTYVSYAGGIAAWATGNITGAKIENTQLRDATCSVNVVDVTATGSYVANENDHELVADRIGGIVAHAYGALNIASAKLYGVRR